MKTPKISIIVTTFNRPNELVKALNSINAQIFRNFEVVVVNDGGESVKEVVKSQGYTFPLRLIEKENGGVSTALNRGIKSSKGRYISFLNDDDVMYPDHLDTLLNFLENRKVRFVYSDSERLTKVREQSGEYRITNRTVISSLDFKMDRLLSENFILTLTILFDRELLSDAGFFDETLKTHEDWDFVLRLAHVEKPLHIKKITTGYSWRKDGRSLTSSKRDDFFRTMQIVFDRYSDFATNKKMVDKKQKRALRSLEREINGGIFFFAREWLYLNIKRPIKKLLGVQ